MATFDKFPSDRRKGFTRAVEKIYVNEIRPDGEISTVGLFYSPEEAEGIVKQLQSLPEKRGCRYRLTDTPPTVSEQPIKEPPPTTRK